MALHSSGFGTKIVAARGLVKWEKGWAVEPDFDGVFCFCLAYLPIVPYEAVHAYESRRLGPGEYQCKTLPIRWIWGLLVRAYLRPWLFLPAGMATLVFLIGIGGLLFAPFKPADAQKVIRVLVLPSLAVSLVGFAGLAALHWTDRRNRAIRRILGPAGCSGSDPATWTEKRLHMVQSPEELFGTADYGQAVEVLLAAGDFARAMLAARFELALGHTAEDLRRGEELTDQVLGNADVQQALRLVRADPRRWTDVMHARR